MQTIPFLCFLQKNRRLEFLLATLDCCCLFNTFFSRVSNKKNWYDSLLKYSQKYTIEQGFLKFYLFEGYS